MPAKMIFGFSMVLVLVQALAPMTSALTWHPEFPKSNDSSLMDYEEFKEKILNDQNWYRAQHGAENLTWSDLLELTSHDAASACNSGFSGSQDIINIVGENHAKDCASVDEAVDYWGLGRTSYDYEQPGSNSSTAFFTQMVWNGTTQVGCARQVCTGWNKHVEFENARWNIICQYMPAGNVAGQFSDNVGRQISGTPTQGISKTSEMMMDKSVHVSGASFNKGSGFLLTAIALAVAIGIQ